MKKSLFLLLALACSACSTVAPRTEQQALLDSQIEVAVRKGFHQEKRVFLDHVDVSSYNGSVWLGGLVFDPQSKAIAIEDAQKVAGVKDVQDSIQISGNAK